MQFNSHGFDPEEGSVVIDCLQRIGHLRENAQRHLRDGFTRRALIVRNSCLYMLDIAAPGRREVLSVEECEWLNILLNSFYVQVRGALDNLAWALHYQYGLLDGGDETKPDVQRRCFLFGGDFLRHVENVEPDLAQRLRAHSEWANDFKQLRDPAAHRVPLYTVPGLATEEQAEAAGEGWRRSLQLLHDGDIGSALEAAAEAAQAGRYEPIMALSTPEGNEVRQLREQIEGDTVASWTWLGLS